MKIALAQINCTVGDLAGNSAKIAHYAQQAREQGAQLLVTPELALCGYPPEDLLLRDDFQRVCDQALEELARQTRGITLVVGCPRRVERQRFNAACVLRDGAIAAVYHKHELPNHTVFDEVRYFSAGTEPCVVEVAGLKLGITICADIWEPGAASVTRAAGAEAVVVLNASPYHTNKQASRHRAIRERIAETGVPFIYVNLVGGQDELVFDGQSFAMDGSGRLVAQLRELDEALALVTLENGTIEKAEVAPALSVEESVYRALCL
ncbi:MAG: nitrilase-related carbon-nitrogen hydrolase, partial [Burkholderiales bacterium]